MSEEEQNENAADELLDEASPHPPRKAPWQFTMRDNLGKLLGDRGLLAEGEDPIKKVSAIAGLLEDLAAYTSVHEPRAWRTVELLWEAADVLSGYEVLFDNDGYDDGEMPDVVFDGETFKPQKDKEDGR